MRREPQVLMYEWPSEPPSSADVRAFIAYLHRPIKSGPSRLTIWLSYIKESRTIEGLERARLFWRMITLLLMVACRSCAVRSWKLSENVCGPPLSCTPSPTAKRGPPISALRIVNPPESLGPFRCSLAS